MVKGHLFHTFIAALLLSLFSTTLLAATLEARVDKKELVSNEHLTLTLALINSDTRLRATGINPNIDLSILTDNFELGIPQASNRYSPFRNRGRSSSEIVVTLFPKGAGKFTIPPFSVDGESSTPITITVHKATAEDIPEVFTRSGVLKSALWLREQTIVYLDLYHRVALKSAKLGGAIESEPKLQIQLSQLPQSDRAELYNGVSYNITRTAWSVAPAINQTIKLFLPDIWVETEAGKKLRFPFKDITIDVLPLPEEVPRHTLVGKPSLAQSAIETEVKQHHNFQLTITLQAPTNIINLSQAAPALPFPEGLKVYAESGVRTAVEGSDDGTTKVTYRYYIMPLEVGNYQLPDLRIPYFDPERSEMNEVVLQGQQFNVIPAAIPVTASSLLPVEATAEITSQLNNTNDTNNAALPWQVATLAFALIWAGTLLVWWKQRRTNFNSRNVTIKPIAQAAHSKHPLHNRLLAAFGTPTLEQGLTQWESQHGIDDEMRTVVQQVQLYCYGPQEKQRPIDHLIDDVDRIIKNIRDKNTTQEQHDMWRPESFTAIH